MKTRISLIVVLLFMFLFQPLQAQNNGGGMKVEQDEIKKEKKNVINWTVTSLLASKMVFGYERALNESIGLRISGGLMFPFSFDLTDASDEIDDFNFDGDGDFSGFDITPELRFYPGTRNAAPEGFFIGPFVRMFSYTVKASGEIDDDGVTRSVDTKITYFSPFSLGFVLGGQWISRKGFTSTLHFGLGSGISRVKTVASNISGYTEADYAEARQDLLDYFDDDEDDIGDELFGNSILNSKVSNTANSITTTTGNFPAIIFRFGFSIGWAF